MLAWSQSRLLSVLAVAWLLSLEPVSWLTAGVPPCIVDPNNYGPYYAEHQECPALHVFLVKLAAGILEKLGDPAWATAAATIVIAIFTFTLWRATSRLWDAGEKQIAIIRDDFTATHRPWVSVKIAIGPRGIYFDDNGMNLHLIFVCKNGGTTPAVSVWVVAEPYLDRQGRQDLEEQRRVCEWIRKRPYHPKAPGKTIFPGDEEIFNTVYTFVGKDDLEKQTCEDYGFVHPIIVGCVDYMFTFGERIHHQTGFIYHVHKIKPPTLGRFAIKPEDGNIGPGNLILDSPTLNSAGFFAD